MLLALSWWAYLLFKKNSELTTEKLKILQVESNIVFRTNAYDIASLDQYNTIMSKHKRQQLMIIGEGIVFGLTMILGMLIINRAHNMELANAKLKRNFLLSVTHELKTPIASVKLILETFKKRVLSPDKIRDLSDSALKENNRLERQINNLLMATKLDKAYEFNFHEEDLVKEIKDIINLYTSLHENLNLQLLTPDVNGRAKVDLEGFRSMITNLIENAIKYSNDKIHIDINIINNNENIIIEVADQGIGISDPEKSKITKQFYRIGNEDTRSTKGTGLGLYIVDKIISAHKGKMTIRDNEPRGTKFILEIPKKTNST